MDVAVDRSSRVAIAGNLLLRALPVAALAGAVGLVRAAFPSFDPAELARAERRLLAHVSVPMTHRFVQAGEHQLHTLIAGSGPPLVLLHGHGGGVGVWYANLERLSRHFRVYALDWLGWGRSERPAFEGRTAEEARDWWVESLEQWRQAVGLSDFLLLGHSLGGWMAAEYAIAYPSRVRRLLLENPAGLMEAVEALKAWFYRVSPQRIVQACGPAGRRLVRQKRGEEATRSSCDPDALLDYYFALTIAPLSGQLAFEKLLDVKRWHLPIVPRAAALTMPTTIFWGLNDDLLRIRHAHHLEMQLPDGRMVLFPDSFHTPHSEEPERFNDGVVSALLPQGG